MKAYPKEKSPLFKLSSRRKLLEVLELKLEYTELTQLVENAENYYKEFSVSKLKDDGSFKIRDIKQPTTTLKVIHKKLSRLFGRVTTPDYLKSKKGSSYKDNALKHLSHDYVITLDIKDFFPSCNRERIAKSLKFHFEMSGDIAYMISKLITFKEIIPQGSNTSSVIAFWSNYSMFEEVNLFCIENNLTLSIFVDDLTISSRTPIDLSLYDSIVGILKKNGFNVKYSKTKYFKKNQIKHITGVALLKDRVDIEFKKRKVFFEALKNKSPSHKEQVSLVGRYNSLKYIDDTFCPTLKSSLKAPIKKRSRK